MENQELKNIEQTFQNLSDEEKKKVTEKTVNLRVISQMLNNALNALVLARSIESKSVNEDYAKNQAEGLILMITNANICLNSVIGALTTQEINNLKENKNDSKTSKTKNC